MTSNSPFSDLPDHLQKPAIRQIQPVPIKKENTIFVGLRDPFQLIKNTIVLPANIFNIVRNMNGDLAAEEIASKSNSPPEQFIDLLSKLFNFTLNFTY